MVRHREGVERPQTEERIAELAEGRGVAAERRGGAAADAGLIAYPAGPRAGAWAYNLSHALLLPGLLALAGWWGGQPIGWQLALIWLVHIGVDRALGFGLKYPRGFRDTHLGRMGTGRLSDQATMRHAPHPADR